MTEAIASKNNSTNRTGRIAVVTGSNKGIGRAIVLAFAKSGTYSGIVVNARKKTRLKEQLKFKESDSLTCRT